MATKRELLEAVARCVSTVVYHHQGGPSRERSEQLAAESRAIADSLARLGLPEGEAEGSILGPVEAELIARFGLEVGPRLAGEFRDAFGGPRTIEDQPPAGPAPAREAPKRGAKDRARVVPGPLITSS